jgi:AcrR family transcriptional regulator
VSRVEATPSPIGNGDDSARLARADRREVLLDAAADMVAAGDVDDVSMDSVADAAGVSRALVYKHFANRRELIGALYERESARLHARLAAAVEAADGFEPTLRALVRGALEAQASRGATFAALGQSGGRTAAQREKQRRRDGRTLRFFTKLAVEEFGLDAYRARTALGVALGSISVVLAQWRLRPTGENAQALEDTFVEMTVGGLKELAGRQ